MSNHYETLNVPRDADAATIKRAHRKLAAQHHPDKGGDVEIFQRIQAAYDTLKDPDKRAYYDRTGTDAPSQRSETEEIVPLVVGAFDRAVVEALGGKKPDARLGGWPTPMSPKGLGRTDMVKTMVRLLTEDKERGIEANNQIAHEAERMREMQRRLGWTGEEGKNILASALAQRLRDADEQSAKNTATIDIVDKAIEHVQLYGWEMDPAPEPKTFYAGGMINETLISDMMRQQMDQILSRPSIRSYRIPTLMPGTKLRFVSEKSKARREAVMDPKTRLYIRPYTCTLDAEGKQVPRPRGSWRAFERHVAQLKAA